MHNIQEIFQIDKENVKNYLDEKQKEDHLYLETLLLESCIIGNEEIVDFLLQNYNTLQKSSTTIFGAIDMCMDYKNTHIIKILAPFLNTPHNFLVRAAMMKGDREDLIDIFLPISSSLQVESALLESIEEHNNKVALKLLNHAKNEDLERALQMRALQVAAKNNNLIIIEKALPFYQINQKMVDQALKMSVMYGHSGVARLLVEKSSQVYVHDLLFSTYYENQFEIVDVLFEYANKDYVTKKIEGLSQIDLQCNSKLVYLKDKIQSLNTKNLIEREIGSKTLNVRKNKIM